MNLEEFLRKFIDATKLKLSIEDITKEIIKRTIFEIKNDNDPNNDYFAEALEMALEEEEEEDLTNFIKENDFYLNLFLASALIIFEEKTQGDIWDSDQQSKINSLLDEVEPFLEIPAE